MNVSVNILNVWLYKSMIWGLGFQLLLNAISILWNFMADYESPGGPFRTHAWVNTLVCSLLGMIVTVLFYSMLLFQVAEWTVLLYLISNERHLNVKKIMRNLKDHTSARSRFNLNETYIRNTVAGLTFIYFGWYLYSRTQSIVTQTKFNTNPQNKINDYLQISFMM